MLKRLEEHDCDAVLTCCWWVGMTSADDVEFGLGRGR